MAPNYIYSNKAMQQEKTCLDIHHHASEGLIDSYGRNPGDNVVMITCCVDLAITYNGEDFMVMAHLLAEAAVNGHVNSLEGGMKHVVMIRNI